MQVLQLTLGIRQYAPLLEVWRKQALVDGATNVRFTKNELQVSLLADLYFFFAMYVLTASKLRLGNSPERQSDRPFGSLEKAAHSFTFKGVNNLQMLR